MRRVLGLCFVLASAGVASMTACHEEFTAPDQPDLYKPRQSFGLDFSVLFPEDLSIPPGDLAHPDLRMADGDSI